MQISLTVEIGQNNRASTSSPQQIGSKLLGSYTRVSTVEKLTLKYILAVITVMSEAHQVKRWCMRHMNDKQIVSYYEIKPKMKI